MFGGPAQPAAVEMFTFNSPKVVDKWHVFTDAYFGGRSQAAFKYNAEEQASPVMQELWCSCRQQQLTTVAAAACTPGAAYHTTCRPSPPAAPCCLPQPSGLSVMSTLSPPLPCATLSRGRDLAGTTSCLHQQLQCTALRSSGSQHSGLQSTQGASPSKPT